jgi:NAD(P)-dependent dehydrogenase (short-subunit alcohol dehydrogenase family)
VEETTVPSVSRTALVTGAAHGIGAGIAERFVEAGYSVAVFDISSEGANAAAQRLQAKGRAIAIAGDVASEDDARNAVERTVAEFGALDVLVNNAGIEVTGSVADLTIAEWDRQIAVNLRGAFLFSKYAVLAMRSRGGAIVNISSVHAFVSWPNSAAYDATKAGLLGLTRAAAIDHGPDGIRVNVICPGYIDTPLIDRWLDLMPDRAAALREVVKLHPGGRIGTPRDIAEAALFLASDAASFISGASLVVDGAMSIIGH